MRRHRRPSVERLTPYFSAASFNVYCSPESREFKFVIVSLIRAMVVELLRVKVVVLRRDLGIRGARSESGHDVHGHGKIMLAKAKEHTVFLRGMHVSLAPC